MVRTAIIGNGAVGKVVGAALAASRTSFGFVSRPGQAPGMTAWTIETGTGPFSYQAPVFHQPPDESESRPDTVIFCVRNDQLNAAMAQNEALWQQANHILFLQGGLQWWMALTPSLRSPDLQRYIDPEGLRRYEDILMGKDVHAGLIGFAATPVNRKASLLARPGTVTFGTLNTCAPASDHFIRLLGDNPFFALRAAENIYQASLHKLCTGVALNAASLRWRQPLGPLLRTQQSRGYIDALAQNMAQGFGVFGIECRPDCDTYLESLASRYPHHYMSVLQNQTERPWLYDRPLALGLKGLALKQQAAQARPAGYAAGMTW